MRRRARCRRAARRACWFRRLARRSRIAVVAGSIARLVAGRMAAARVAGRMAAGRVVGRKLAVAVLRVRCSEDKQTESPPERM